MGRRRRKVIRRPKRRLPQVLLCPKCSRNSVRVDFEQLKVKICVECGRCGQTTKETIGQPIRCSQCDRKIAASSISDANLKMECGTCSTPGFFDPNMALSWTTFNCSCPMSKQTKFMIEPEERQATVKCGHCGLIAYFKAGMRDEHIDVYQRFFDAYYDGRYRGIEQLSRQR